MHICRGHGVIPLGLLEGLTISSIITGDFDTFPLYSFWTLVSVFILAGQLLTIIAIVLKGKKYSNVFGLIGNTCLIAATLTMFYALPEQVYLVSLLTSIPFVIFSTKFWNAINKTSTDKPIN